MRQVEKGAVEHDLDAAVRAAEAAEKLAAERGAALAAAVWRVRELEAAAAGSVVAAAKLGARSRSPATLRKPPHLQKLLASSHTAAAAAAAGGSSEGITQQQPAGGDASREVPARLGPTTPVAASPPLPCLQPSSSSGGDSPTEEEPPPALPLSAARSGSLGLRASRSLSRRLSSGPGFATLADANLGEPGLCRAASQASSVDAFFDARSDAGSALSAPGSIAVAMLQASCADAAHLYPFHLRHLWPPCRAHLFGRRVAPSAASVGDQWRVKSKCMQPAGEAGGAAGACGPVGAGEGAG
jgi:hypothetical protein